MSTIESISIDVEPFSPFEASTIAAAAGAWSPSMRVMVDRLSVRSTCLGLVTTTGKSIDEVWIDKLLVEIRAPSFSFSVLVHGLSDVPSLLGQYTSVKLKVCVYTYSIYIQSFILTHSQHQHHREINSFV